MQSSPNMITFKDYLTEGGNLKLGTHKADPVDVANTGRDKVKKQVHGFLSSLHHSFEKETGHQLFGEDRKSLHNHTAYSGSTKHLFNKDIPDDEFVKHKSSLGDIDVQVPKEHAHQLHAHLAPGKKFGDYTIVGTKKHGAEVSAIAKHKDGSHHQFDFELTDHKNGEPTEFEQFAHSSDWHDTKAGVKGMHHKVLLNAIGGEDHKFSITHGLRSRTDETDPGEKTVKGISTRLFGSAGDHKDLGSFHGLVKTIGAHVPPGKHQAIYDKFKDSLSKMRGDHAAALAHARKHLNVKDSITESAEEVHHTTVVPIMGASPHSHMGHAADLGGALHKLPGSKHVGISGKSEAFTHEERKSILERQWGKGTNAHVVTGAGETIRKAHNSMPKTGRKVLHLLVGHDRKSLAEGLKKSLEAGKIKEMEGHKFDEIHIHHPEDTDRKHGMSGTKMRMAAHTGNIEEYHKHLGSVFSRKEATAMMKKTQASIRAGTTPLKR